MNNPISPLTGDARMVTALIGLFANAMQGGRNALFSLKSKNRAVRFAGRVAKKTAELRYIKTLWQPERDVDFETFYYPPTFLLDGNSKTCTYSGPKSLWDGTQYPRLVLEGMAGQGKSLFARKFVVDNHRSGASLCPLVHLREYRPGELAQIIQRGLARVGLSAPFRLGKSNEILDWVLAHVPITLVLDGLDECSPDARPALCRELEILASDGSLSGNSTSSSRASSLRVLITTRPHSGAEFLSRFRVIRFCSLRPKEYVDVLDYVASTSTQKRAIVHALSSRPELEDILVTPLLVTLIVVAFRIRNNLPDRIAQLYEDLFSVLLRRHDEMKADFVRARRCGLDDGQMLYAFDTFCFALRAQGITLGTETQLVDCCLGLAKTLEFNLRPSDFLRDIRDTTSLLVADGAYLTFLHKSVQEFHSARFIRSRSDMKVESFYNSIGGERAIDFWEPELSFLESIDAYRFAKHFAVPRIKRIEQNSGCCLRTLHRSSPESLAKLLTVVSPTVHIWLTGSGTVTSVEFRPRPGSVEAADPIQRRVAGYAVRSLQRLIRYPTIRGYLTGLQGNPVEGSDDAVGFASWGKVVVDVAEVLEAIQSSVPTAEQIDAFGEAGKKIGEFYNRMLALADAARAADDML